ncbi:hypothetical protein DSO57_1024199 [Entomophthora muscae]|uniref:Uncharacterized protein n=1 Tax=Entomophthora muscae TaxID=34485 RepID=A0ACC2SFZ2_9FUNG|nr:hypothetical protein DSO57_1024199 [Entomophthora muscae]
MTIEEHGIKDLIDTYNLVEKFFCIKVENLPDEKASHWDLFSKKVNKEPKPADLSDKLTEVLRTFMATGKPAPRYNNRLCFNCRSAEHQAKDCLEKCCYCKEDHCGVPGHQSPKCVLGHSQGPAWRSCHPPTVVKGW